MVSDSRARSYVAIPAASALVAIGATLLFTSDLGRLTLQTPRAPWSSSGSVNVAPSNPPESPDGGKKKGKTALESVVHVTYPTTLEMCDAGAPLLNTNSPQTIKTGALLKLIDVVAGVTARKHAGFSCVTISVDSVLLLKPIYLGELVHLSASVNRAWGSSLEVGVRVVAEEKDTGVRKYVSHSYLTFVAVAPSPTSGSGPPPGVRLASRPATSSEQNASTIPIISSLLSYISSPKTPATPKRPQLEPLIPRTPLEARRHILAGRRRAKRIDDAKRGEARDGVPIEVKRRVREEVKNMHGSHGASAGQGARGDTEKLAKIEEQDFATISAKQQHQQMELLELEFVVAAYVAKDPAVHVLEESGTIEVQFPGDAPLKYDLAEIKRLAARVEHRERRNTLGGASFDPSSPDAKSLKHTEDVVFQHEGLHSSSLPAPPIKSPNTEHLTLQNETGPLVVTQTLSRTLHLVFPEHSNSVSVLFGGQLMEWMEEAALLSARYVGRGERWATVALDGLEFPQAVAIGEVMSFTAIVTKTFSSSCEVYVLAEAESANGTRRVTNDALFTLAFHHRAKLPNGELRTDHTVLREVVMPEGSALDQFAAVAQKRKESRLDLRKMLLRIYSSTE